MCACGFEHLSSHPHVHTTWLQGPGAHSGALLHGGVVSVPVFHRLSQEALWGEISISRARRVTYFNLTLFVLAKQFLSFQDKSNMLVGLIYFSLLSELNLGRN